MGDYKLLDHKFNATFTADTDILDAFVSGVNLPSKITINIVLTTSGIVTLQIKEGGTTKTGMLNGGVALTAGCLYNFDHVLPPGQTLNIQTDTTSLTSSITVVEHIGDA